MILGNSYKSHDLDITHHVRCDGTTPPTGRPLVMRNEAHTKYKKMPLGQDSYWVPLVCIMPCSFEGRKFQPYP